MKNNKKKTLQIICGLLLCACIIAGFTILAVAAVENTEGAKAWGDGTTSGSATIDGQTYSGVYTTAWGYHTNAVGNYATAWGIDSKATYINATAFGKNSVASGENSLAALGGIAKRQDSAAIGYQAVVDVEGTVALGSGSEASRAMGDTNAYLKSDKEGGAWISTHNAIAVGKDDTVTRQITGVAAGSQDTDAVNVAQLKAAINEMSARLGFLQVMSEISANTGSDMIYTGNPIPLINTPNTALPEGYTIKYCATTENTVPADNLYTTSIPTGTNAGTYYVWCKVIGDADYNNDNKAVCIVVEIKSESSNAKDTLNKGFAAPEDTIALTKKVTKFGDIINTLQTSSDCQLTVVKGTKFYVSDMDEKAEGDYNKKLYINKKGKVYAKRTSDSPLHFWFDHKKTGNKITVTINIIEPEIEGGNGLKAETKVGETFDFATSIPLNAEFRTAKNKGVAENLTYRGNAAIGADGKLHIKGTALKKGKVKIPFSVDGKNFKAVIKVSS